MLIKNLQSIVFFKCFIRLLFPQLSWKVNEAVANDIFYGIVKLYIQVRVFLLQETPL